MDQASNESSSHVGFDQVEEGEVISLANLNDPIDYEIATTEYLCLYKNIIQYESSLANSQDRYPKDPIPWIKKIWDAILNVEGITDKRLKSGKLCQAATRITTGYYPNFAIERACWDVMCSCYDTVQGGLVASHHFLKFDESFKAIENRLEKVIEVLRINKAICKMLLDPSFISRLVDNPSRELKSKENNNKINAIRDQQNHIGREAIKRGVNDKEEIKLFLGPELPKTEKVKAVNYKKSSIAPRAKKGAGTKKISSAKRKRTSRAKKADEDEELEEYYESEFDEEDEEEFYDLDEAPSDSPQRPKRSRARTGQQIIYKDDHTGSDQDSANSEFQPKYKTPKKRVSHTEMYSSPYRTPSTTLDGYGSTNEKGQMGSATTFNNFVTPSKDRMYSAQPNAQGFSGSPSDIFSFSATQTTSSANGFSPFGNSDFVDDSPFVRQKLFTVQPKPPLQNGYYPLGTQGSSPGQTASSTSKYLPVEIQQSSSGQGSLSKNVFANYEVQQSSLNETNSLTDVYAPRSARTSTPTPFSEPLRVSELVPENKTLLVMYQNGLQEDAQLNSERGGLTLSPGQKQIGWQFRGLPRTGSDHDVDFDYRIEICTALRISPFYAAKYQLKQLRTYAHGYNEQFHTFSWIPEFNSGTTATGAMVSTETGWEHLCIADKNFLEIAMLRNDVDEGGHARENLGGNIFSVKSTDKPLQEALGMIPNRFGLHYAVLQALEEMHAAEIRWDQLLQKEIVCGRY